MEKKSNLSLDEILKQALLKNKEKPYILPDNWLWVRLAGVVNDIKNGTTLTQNKEKIGLPVTRIESIQDNKIDSERLGYIADVGKIKETDYYKYGNIALSHINSAEHVGKTAIITKDFLPLVHGMNLIKLTFNKSCNPYYFYYFSQSFYYKQEILNRINMAVNQVSINQKQLKDIPIPLPSYAEQQRIVDLIQSLFEKLDRAKEIVRNMLDSFEKRKSAILHKAFKGELTAKWRNGNGVDFVNGWKVVDLESVAFAIDPHPSHRTPAVCEDGVPYIGIAECNYRTSQIDFLNARKVSKTVLDEHIQRYDLFDGDFIIGKIGTIGKPFLIPPTRDYLLSANVVLIQPRRNLMNSKYLFYMFQSSQIEIQLFSGIKATTQAAFGIQKVRKLKINYCSIEEQNEVVRLLDNLLENEHRAKELCDVIDNIDLMKKSILARAFRGELNTNDPHEDSALELLKESLKEKVEG